VKKAGSIFLLVLFFVFQYGRILDYMECRIAAAIETKTDCGCETRLIAATDNETSAPLHEHSLKNYTEEFFDHENSSTTALNISVTKQYNNRFVQSSPVGFSKSIFQPPRAGFHSLI
jgi:hypothetical protein